MALYQSTYRIETARLAEWDYASGGWYFITICTRNRQSSFGAVIDGRMKRSPTGDIACKQWVMIPERFDRCVLDAFIVMPNHVHGLLGLMDKAHSEERKPAVQFGPLRPDSISSVINHYKGRCTRRIRHHGIRDFAWQPRFHDHIIRNKRALLAIRRYIMDNPARWPDDKLHPDYSK